MYTLFKPDPQPPSSVGDREVREPGANGVPRLLLDLPPWPEVFFGNLAELLLAPFRRGSPAPATREDNSYWTDVFVPPWRPAGAFSRSAVCHLLAAVALWACCQTWWGRSLLQPRPPFQNYTVIYYPVSEYLPPLNGSAELPPSKIDRPGAPAFARQRIVSLPPHPDNDPQTIACRRRGAFVGECPAYILAWSGPSVQPAAASALAARLIAPRLPNAVELPPEAQHARTVAPAMTLPALVPPPPQVERSSSLVRAPLLADPVAPPPDLSTATAKKRSLPVPPVVEPPPTVDTLRAGALNIARMDPQIGAPQLPKPEQQARWVKAGRRAADISRNADPGRAPAIASATAFGSIGPRPGHPG